MSCLSWKSLFLNPSFASRISFQWTWELQVECQITVVFFFAFGSRYYRKKVTNFLVANPGYVKPSMRPQTTKEVANTPETGTMTEDISFVAKNAEIPKDTKDGRATSRANGKKKRKSPSKSSSSSRSGSRSSRSSSSSSTSSRSSKSSRNGPHSPLSPVSPVQPGDDPFK